MIFFASVFQQKFKWGRGTLIKWLISKLSNVVQNLHSLAQRKNMQVAKIGRYSFHNYDQKMLF